MEVNFNTPDDSRLPSTVILFSY